MQIQQSMFPLMQPMNPTNNFNNQQQAAMPLNTGNDRYSVFREADNSPSLFSNPEPRPPQQQQQQQQGYHNGQNNNGWM